MSLRYLLDTNICIYITKHSPKSVLEKFESLTVGEVGMSMITYGELLFGCQKSHYPQKSRHIIEKLSGLIPPLPMSIEAGKHYSEIRYYLEKIGKPIGNNDLWIAAHARSLELILITNNKKEFSRVPKLKIENWV